MSCGVRLPLKGRTTNDVGCLIRPKKHGVSGNLTDPFFTQTPVFLYSTLSYFGVLGTVDYIKGRPANCASVLTGH